MKTRLYLIINPNAGKGKAAKQARFVIQKLETLGFECIAFFTEYAGHARDYVAHLDGEAHVIVALGGDGTVNEIINGIDSLESHTLGVIPLGTGNDFARLIGARKTKPAFGILQSPNIRSFDIAELDCRTESGGKIHHRFINTMGIGFDAAVAVRVQSMTWGSGILPYLYAVLTTLRRYHAIVAQISTPEESFKSKLFLATIGNGTTSGGGFILTPQAVPTDGLLDLCFVGDVSIPRVISILPKTFSGSHLSAQEVSIMQARSFQIELERPLPVHADGEIVTTSARELSIRMHQQKLPVNTSASVPY